VSRIANREAKFINGVQPQGAQKEKKKKEKHIGAMLRRRDEFIVKERRDGSLSTEPPADFERSEL